MGGVGRIRRTSRRTFLTVIVTSALLITLLLLLIGLLAVPPDLLGSENGSVGAAVSLKREEISHRALRDLDLQLETWVEPISWEPRAFIYHNMLVRTIKLIFFWIVFVILPVVLGSLQWWYSSQSEKECNHMINLAKPSMRKSTVVDSATGQSKDSRVRTSSGTFLARGQDKIIAAIEERIAKFTFIPIKHGEGFQVLHYEEGQKYDAHHDYFHDDFNVKNGGQRMATVLMYLTDVEAGGETVFPAAEVNRSVEELSNLSECARKGLSVKPRRGDALLFWSMKPDATLDPMSLHGGCPVIRGNKWSATKWLHVGEYEV